MTDANQVVTAFLEELAQPKPRVEELLSFFTDDAVWWDAPPSQREARGTDELRAKFEHLNTLVDTMTAVEVLNQVAEGDTVLSERVDRALFRGDEYVVEICAVFKVRGEKISSWRDYWAEPVRAGQAEGTG